MSSSSSTIFPSSLSQERTNSIITTPNTLGMVRSQSTSALIQEPHVPFPRAGKSESNLVLMPSVARSSHPSEELSSPVLRSPVSLSELQEAQQKQQRQQQARQEVLQQQTLSSSLLQQGTNVQGFKQQGGGNPSTLRVAKADLLALGQVLKEYREAVEVWSKV